jgi:hypothetical protein
MARFESRAHWLLSACLLLGCSRHDDAQGASPATAGQRAETPNLDPSAGRSPIVEFTEPYPAGHWRLVEQKELDRVMLWCSQILIRHRDVPPGMVSFHSPHWWGAPPAPARSRAEAFALAQQVAARVTEHPERFADLARTYSEDIATRDVGGDVGGVQASQVPQPVFLDVLATLRPGEISRVFESGYGFHILMRRAPPEERTVSGSHIVFAHDDAPWVQRFLARPGHPQARRSKAQALALAEQVYAEAKQNPSAFATLVERYSDHEDASRGGDFGAWSSREPTPFRREVSTLLRLKVDEVAPPLDTLFGVQIILRTEDRPRVVYTSSSLQRGFNPEAPAGDPQSEAAVLQQMTALAGSLRLAPERFEHLPREWCCAEQKTWLAGTELARYESPLERLLPGQITAQPFKHLNSYVISKRLTPAALAKPSVVFELPAPSHREAAALVSAAGMSVWQWAAGTIEKELPLDAATRAQLASLHQLSDADAQTFDLVAAFNAVQTKVRDLLGPRYPEYLDRLRDALEAFLLDNSPEFRLGVSSAPEGFFASGGTQGP